MANIYVRSTDGSNADSGATWALAKADISGASAIDAAGDVIYLSQSHSESVATSSNAWAGTEASPVRILGGNDAAEPPTALSTAPTITLTGTTFTWSGAAYTYGINFTFTSASSHAPTFNDGTGFTQKLESCNFFMNGAGAGSTINFGSIASGGQSRTELLNCTFKLANSAQAITVNRALYINGGSWASGGTTPTSIFTIASGARSARLEVSGFDFSALGASVNLVRTITEGSAFALFRNCKLPASWSGSLVASGAIKVGTRIEMHNCDSGNTNYRLWVEESAGNVKSETTIVRTGGASDGTTTLAWKMASTANVKYPASALSSPEIVKWNETTGIALTATVEVVTDGVTLTDSECWLEIQHLGTSSFPRSVFASDAKADVLASDANQTTSSETWTTTGLASPIKQKLSVTFTPQMKGYAHAVVKLAKPSTTVYVDPSLTIA